MACWDRQHRGASWLLRGHCRTVLVAGLALASLPAPAAAQRAATADDFLGLTYCVAGRPVTRFRSDVTDSLLLRQLHAHEAVHRRQAAAFSSCEGFLASLISARRIIDAELPAYCAQWRVAVAQGARPDSTRREFAWRISAQSGAMENRLHIAQRMEDECPLEAERGDGTQGRGDGRQETGDGTGPQARSRLPSPVSRLPCS